MNDRRDLLARARLNAWLAGFGGAILCPLGVAFIDLWLVPYVIGAFLLGVSCASWIARLDALRDPGRDTPGGET